MSWRHVDWSRDGWGRPNFRQTSTLWPRRLPQWRGPQLILLKNPVVGMKIRVALVSALLAVSGCGTLGNGPAVTVAPQPAAAPPSNAKVATTIISAMAGGLVGGSIGTGLSEPEKRKALEAEYKALEYTASGQKVTWKSDSSAHSGEVVAAQPYRVGSQDCRQYTHTVFTGTAGATARGTACRNADGSWTPLT
jgi:surface antigen